MNLLLEHLRSQLADVDAMLAKINDSKETLIQHETKLAMQKSELLKGIAQLTIVKEEVEKTTQ